MSKYCEDYGKKETSQKKLENNLDLDLRWSNQVRHIGLIQVREEGWTGFSKGWQGCSEGFPKGEAGGKSQGSFVSCNCIDHMLV